MAKKIKNKKKPSRKPSTKKTSSKKKSSKKTSTQKLASGKSAKKKNSFKNKIEEHREYTRFKPAVSLCAQLDTNIHNHHFNSQQFGLVLNQSPGGCALVITQNEELKLKSTFKIKIDEELPIPAEVVWRVDLDSEVAKVGIRFLDQ